MADSVSVAHGGVTITKAWQRYRRKPVVAELRPYAPGESLAGISIAEVDREAGSPRAGDMIARNPANHADQWLVAAQYFAEHFEAHGVPIDASLEVA